MSSKKSKNVKSSLNKEESVQYFDINFGIPIKPPGAFKRLASRLALPLLALLSREQSINLGLTPLDDERVIMALRHAEGRALDIGCGANNFIRSYGNGVGVDVFPWEGCDQVIENSAKLPFKDHSFQTVSYLACLNHIPERTESLKEAYRVLSPGGTLLITMIPPRWGRFIHWIRFRNDPDHKDRHIDHDHELLGMHPTHVNSLISDAGFSNIDRKKFVYGINSLYVAKKN